MIHYRDDLFLLSLHTKSLEAAFSLDADPEFWKEQVLKEIIFVDETIRAVADLLAKNHHLVDREDYLRLLERLSLDFARALDRFKSGSSLLSRSLADEGPRIHNITLGHQELAKNLALSLSENESAENIDGSIVSDDEIAKLLGDGQS
jgi:hypothetical protein